MPSQPHRDELTLVPSFPQSIVVSERTAMRFTPDRIGITQLIGASVHLATHGDPTCERCAAIRADRASSLERYEMAEHTRETRREELRTLIEAAHPEAKAWLDEYLGLTERELAVRLS